MIGGLLLIIILYFITQPLLQNIKAGKRWFKMSLMNNLFWYHMLFFFVYYVFTLNARSDSFGYFNRPPYYDDWFSIYQTGTKFIDFLGYPLIVYLGFTYEMMMVLFAWFGYWGFVFFYSFFKENITYTHKWQGYDLITLFIFLPNMHYWTSSLGKGSVIFLGLAMAMYGLSQLKNRKALLILGLLIVYHVRPHVFLFMSAGIVAGLFTGKQKVPFYQKFLVMAASAGAMIYMYNDILAFAGLDTENVVGSFEALSSHRSVELAKANSGIDISKYPLVLKLFTFWFRPLFIDAPGPVGIIVSFENLLYLWLTLKLFKPGFFKFIGRGSALVKTSVVVFLATSFALSGTLSNMGIIVRQKSMVMYFLLFVILAFMDYKKDIRVNRQKMIMRQRELQPATANEL